MSNRERTRQVVSGEFGPEDLQRKLAEGWKPVAIEWERQLATDAVTATPPAPEVPFGLRVSGDCLHLIEAGPGILMSEEWRQRRRRMKAGTP